MLIRQEYTICQSKEFSFQPPVYNGSHDVLNMSTDLNSIVIVNINSIDNCCINGISEAVNLF